MSAAMQPAAASSCPAWCAHHVGDQNSVAGSSHQSAPIQWETAPHGGAPGSHISVCLEWFAGAGDTDDPHIRVEGHCGDDELSLPDARILADALEEVGSLAESVAVPRSAAGHEAVILDAVFYEHDLPDTPSLRYRHNSDLTVSMMNAGINDVYVAEGGVVVIGLNLDGEPVSAVTLDDVQRRDPLGVIDDCIGELQRLRSALRRIG